jgi:hypothetical protein
VDSAGVDIGFKAAETLADSERKVYTRIVATEMILAKAQAEVNMDEEKEASRTVWPLARYPTTR